MTEKPLDKLAHIAALRPRAGEDVRRGTPQARGQQRERLLRLLGAEERTTRLGSHLGLVCRFPGSCPSRIGSRASRLLAPHAASEVTNPGRWLFLDTETTGLAGGTGTYAFLVGVAWWEADGLVVEQFFMRDHGEEPSLLLALSERLSRRPVLVTFNGKSFDWPLLETRYRITRVAALEKPAAHLDLLHPARQLWRWRLPSVALAELEREILAIERGADIPSHTIPARYFEFLRGGPEGPIVEIFRHNQLDLCGLAALAARIAALLEEPKSAMGDAFETYGVSRMLQREGETMLAAEGYQRALAFGLPEGADRIARRELALLSRKRGDYAGAHELWQELVGDSPAGLQAYEQLAIHYEHRAREPRLALQLTREALVRAREAALAGRLDGAQFHRWHAALQHRLARLQSLLEGNR